MKVSQLDQIRQAFEEAVCTVESLRKRIKSMKDVKFVSFNQLIIFSM